MLALEGIALEVSKKEEHLELFLCSFPNLHVVYLYIFVYGVGLGNVLPHPHPYKLFEEKNMHFGTW